jgi:hypothetical protein
MAPPLLDEDLGFALGVEYLAVQQLVPEPSVEALAVAVRPSREKPLIEYCASCIFLVRNNHNV